jgi:hypothetical protein
MILSPYAESLAQECRDARDKELQRERIRVECDLSEISKEERDYLLTLLNDLPGTES